MTRPRGRVRAARELILEERRRQEGELVTFGTRLILRLFAEGRLVYRERVHFLAWDVAKRAALARGLARVWALLERSTVTFSYRALKVER